MTHTPIPRPASAVVPTRRRPGRHVLPALLLALAACAPVPVPGTNQTIQPRLPQMPWPAPRPAVPAPYAPAPGPVVVTPGNVAAAPPVATAATLPAARPATGQAAPIIIQNDRGGNVVQTMARRADLAASGRPIEIRGACDSACTMLITLPNACLAPDATVGFHAPRLPGTQVIPPIVDQLMATNYRNGIRARWYNEWRHSLTIQRITAQEYVRLDPMTRLCPA